MLASANQLKITYEFKKKRISLCRQYAMERTLFQGIYNKKTRILHLIYNLSIQNSLNQSIQILFFNSDDIKNHY